MLQLVVASEDEETSPPRFDITYQPLQILQSYCPVSDKVRMADINEALSYPNRTWRFLVDPLGLADRAMYNGEPLALHSLPVGLSAHRTRSPSLGVGSSSPGPHSPGDPCHSRGGGCRWQRLLHVQVIAGFCTWVMLVVSPRVYPS